MDSLSSEILLTILQKLNSQQMMLMMRVQKNWLFLIDNHKTLFRELVMPYSKYSSGWGIQWLQHFDKKCESRLRQVSMELKPRQDPKAVMEILERNKETLQSLDIDGGRQLEQMVENNLSSFCNVVDCRLYRPSSSLKRVFLFKVGGWEDEVSRPKVRLKVLWVRFPRFTFSNLEILDNSISLVVEDLRINSSEWREFLDRPSQTLKHLQACFLLGDDNKSLSELVLPNLQVLEIHSSKTSKIPRWLKFDKTCTLILRNFDSISSPTLPSFSSIWVDHPYRITKLQNYVPELEELRINGPLQPVFYSHEMNSLFDLLLERKRHVKAKFKVKGVRMIDLKTLVIPFNQVKEEDLMRLRTLVEEVVDFKTVSKFFKVEF